MRKSKRISGCLSEIKVKLHNSYATGMYVVMLCPSESVFNHCFYFIGLLLKSLKFYKSFLKVYFMFSLIYFPLFQVIFFKKTIVCFAEGKT